MDDHHLNLTGFPNTPVSLPYTFVQPGTSTSNAGPAFGARLSGNPSGLEDIPDIEAYERSLHGHNVTFNMPGPLLTPQHSSDITKLLGRSENDSPLESRNVPFKLITPKVEVIDDQTPMMSPVSTSGKTVHRANIKLELIPVLDPDGQDDDPEAGVTYPEPVLFDVKNTIMTEYDLDVLKHGKNNPDEFRRRVELPDASAPPNKIVEFLMYHRTLKESELNQLNSYRTKRNRLSLNLVKSTPDREFDQKACESLVKKLKDRKHDLQNLIDVVNTKGAKYQGCITIPRTLDGRLQVHGKKGFPHVVYGKLWRYSEMSKNETRHVDHCKHAFEMKTDAVSESLQVCVNPYHYEIVIGTMIVGDAPRHQSMDDYRFKPRPSNPPSVMPPHSVPPHHSIQQHHPIPPFHSLPPMPLNPMPQKQMSQQPTVHQMSPPHQPQHQMMPHPVSQFSPIQQGNMHQQAMMHGLQMSPYSVPQHSTQPPFPAHNFANPMTSNNLGGSSAPTNMSTSFGYTQPDPYAAGTSVQLDGSSLNATASQMQPPNQLPAFPHQTPLETDFGFDFSQAMYPAIDGSTSATNPYFAMGPSNPFSDFNPGYFDQTLQGIQMYNFPNYHPSYMTPEPFPFQPPATPPEALPSSSGQHIQAYKVEQPDENFPMGSGLQPKPEIEQKVKQEVKQEPLSVQPARQVRDSRITIAEFRRACKQEFGERFFVADDSEPDVLIDPDTITVTEADYTETPNTTLLGVKQTKRKPLPGRFYSGPWTRDCAYPDMANFLMNVSTVTINMNGDEPPSVIGKCPPWGTLTYYEEDFKVSEMNALDRGTIIVDGGFLISDARFSLGLCENPYRSTAAYKVRKAIVDGVKFSYKEDGSVWLTNFMTFPVFITSGYLDDQSIGLQNDKTHKLYGNSKLKVFGLRRTKELIRDKLFSKYFAQSYIKGAVTSMNHVFRELNIQDIEKEAQTLQDDISKYCFVRASFCKGFGKDYPRATIAETPVWVELRMHAAYKFMDAVTYDLNRHYLAKQNKEFASLNVEVHDDDSD
ncbi:hypothetical protein B9Z55_022246 [Caenorhabditis nigoni]|uniref:Uncharacterized protein n=1 Tax=Caenorhabditis nigoni TaxID=1611254 RepID=A0A2G5SJT0_9PELO|nr:hypothetical protein B9Z55_022246 [Caenorhabditis nigoni]